MEPRLNRKLYIQQDRNKSATSRQSTANEQHLDTSRCCTTNQQIDAYNKSNSCTSPQLIEQAEFGPNAARRLRRSNFCTAQGELTSQ